MLCRARSRTEPNERIRRRTHSRSVVLLECLPIDVYALLARARGPFLTHGKPDMSGSPLNAPDLLDTGTAKGLVHFESLTACGPTDRTVSNL
jgi:hypothetical protein